MTKTCPGCGADAPPEARFCRHCGTTLRTTTGGGIGGETISPLAATAPLVEQRGITSELDNGAPPCSAPLHTATDREMAATLLSTPVQSDSREITIPVGGPTTMLQSVPDASAPHVSAPPAAALAPPPAPSSAPISAALPPGAVSESRQAPEHRALRVWLAAGLLGLLLLLCVGGAGVWLMLRARQTPAPAISTDAPVVVAPPDAQQQAQAKIAEAQGLLATGNPVAATARLREALALDPANAEAHRQLAQLLMESGARETAIVELRAVTRLEPNDKDAWRQLAEAQFAAGQYADAADSYHTLMDVSNEALADDRLQLAYADALRLAGRTDNAQALYRRLATSPLADVARTSKQHVKELNTTTTSETVTNAPMHGAGTTAASNTQPTPASNMPTPTPPRLPAAPVAAPVALSPAEHYQRGVELWASNRAAAAAEFRAAAGAGNADAYYYLGLNLAEGRAPHALGRAELVSALAYFQRARASRFSAQAQRYEDQLGQEFDRRRKQ